MGFKVITGEPAGAQCVVLAVHLLLKTAPPQALPSPGGGQAGPGGGLRPGH